MKHFPCAKCGKVHGAYLSSGVLQCYVKENTPLHTRDYYLAMNAIRKDHRVVTVTLN